jgi:hypothetical protein
LSVLTPPSGSVLVASTSATGWPAADGQVRRTTAFSTTRLPTRIAAANLTGDGLDDLVVADSLDDTVQVAFQRPDDTFSAPLTLAAGVDPSDLALVDVNGDGLPDIVASNQASGDVSVFLNDPSHTFATSYLVAAVRRPPRPRTAAAMRTGEKADAAGEHEGRRGIGAAAAPAANLPGVAGMPGRRRSRREPSPPPTGQRVRVVANGLARG